MPVTANAVHRIRNANAIANATEIRRWVRTRHGSCPSQQGARLNRRIETSMISISLSQAEAEVISQALHSYHDTLLLELSKADSLRFKEGLREREAVVARVLNQLRAGRSAETGAATSAD